MEQFVQIPKDLQLIRQKFILGLTKRQAICFGIGGLCGIPVFFLLKGVVGLTVAVLGLGVAATPAVLCGIYQKNGMYFDERFKYMLKFWCKPEIRAYESENIFEQIDRQMEIERCNKMLKGVMIVERKKGRK